MWKLVSPQFMHFSQFGTTIAPAENEIIIAISLCSEFKRNENIQKPKNTDKCTPELRQTAQ